MIFFTIEFPPSIYQNDKCKFIFNYDNNNQKVLYNKPKNYSECNIIKDNNVELYNKYFENKEVIEQSTHQAFLKSTNNNSTDDYSKSEKSEKSEQSEQSQESEQSKKTESSDTSNKNSIKSENSSSEPKNSKIESIDVLISNKCILISCFINQFFGFIYTLNKIRI
jgi:cobalamin biosynthesis Mg chelatase CobN